MLAAVLGGADDAVRVGVGGPEGLGGTADLVAFAFFEALADGEPDADAEGDDSTDAAEYEAVSSRACAPP